jgi:hypothetical protein
MYCCYVHAGKNFMVSLCIFWSGLNFPSNRALKEQVNEKQTYHHLQLKFKFEFYKIISGQPQNTLMKFT